MARGECVQDYRKPENRLTPVRAIRKKCLDCCGGSRKLIRECEIHDCPLWPYRLGKRPTPDGAIQPNHSAHNDVTSSETAEYADGGLRSAPS